MRFPDVTAPCSLTYASKTLMLFFEAFVSALFTVTIALTCNIRAASRQRAKLLFVDR
jgi:hypothetical protein